MGGLGGVCYICDMCDIVRHVIHGATSCYMFSTLVANVYGCNTLLRHTVKPLVQISMRFAGLDCRVAK